MRADIGCPSNVERGWKKLLSADLKFKDGRGITLPFIIMVIRHGYPTCLSNMAIQRGYPTLKLFARRIPRAANRI
jgi:hypothetical protein